MPCTLFLCNSRFRVTTNSTCWSRRLCIDTSQKYTMQHVYSWFTVNCLFLSFNACLPLVLADVTRMTIPKWVLKSIPCWLETSPLSTCTFQQFHSCTGYNSRRPLIIFKCSPRDLQKQKVSQKDWGSVFTSHTPSMKQAPHYTLTASGTFQLLLILVKSSLKKNNKSSLRLPWRKPGQPPGLRWEGRVFVTTTNLTGWTRLYFWYFRLEVNHLNAHTGQYRVTHQHSSGQSERTYFIVYKVTEAKLGRLCWNHNVYIRT